MILFGRPAGNATAAWEQRDLESGNEGAAETRFKAVAVCTN